MLRQAFANYSFVTASCIALFAFLAVFAGTLLWVFRKNSSEIYKEISKLPLQDGSEESR